MKVILTRDSGESEILSLVRHVVATLQEVCLHGVHPLAIVSSKVAYLLGLPTQSKLSVHQFSLKQLIQHDIECVKMQRRYLA